MKIECLLPCDNHLGEGPVWDVDEGCLYRRQMRPTRPVLCRRDWEFALIDSSDPVQVG